MILEKFMTVEKQGLSPLWNESFLKVFSADPLVLSVTDMTSFISLPSVAFIHEEILPLFMPKDECIGTVLGVLSSTLRFCHTEAVGDSWCNWWQHFLFSQSNYQAVRTN